MNCKIFEIALLMIFMPLAVCSQNKDSTPVEINRTQYVQKDKNLCKVILNLAYIENPIVEKYCSKFLFGDTISTSLKEAVEKYQTEKYKIKRINETWKYKLKLENGKEGKFQSYFMRYEKSDEKKVRSKQRNFVYDIKHDKILSLDDIFTPAYAAEYEMQTEGSFVHLIMSGYDLVIGYKQDGTMRTKQLSFVEVEHCLTDTFKELIDWDDARAEEQRRLEVKERNQTIAREKEQQAIEDRKQRDAEIEKRHKEALLASQNNNNQAFVVLGNGDVKVFDVVEQMPCFRGGDATLIEWLSKNIKYPVEAEENGIQGKVVCTFVIEKDGSITDVKIVKSVVPALDNEAVRVLKAMPKWIPGKQDGKAIRVKYTLPVTFRLTEEQLPKGSTPSR